MKRIIFLFVCLFELTQTVDAQLFGGFLSTSNQQIVSDAVKDVFVIIEQNYQLQDSTGQRYGRLNNEEFGKSFSCGIRINKELWVTAEAACPWEKDDNFTKYKDRYTPVFMKTMYKEIGDTVMHVFEGFDAIEFSQHDQSPLYYYHNGEDGLTLDTIVGDREGWSVWLISNKKQTEADEETEFTLSIIKSSIAIEEEASVYDVTKPRTEQNVWGGIMVIPVSIGRGVIAFRLVGVYTKNRESDSWQLIKLSSQSPKTIKEGGSEVEDELTPIKKKDKKKK